MDRRYKYLREEEHASPQTSARQHCGQELKKMKCLCDALGSLFIVGVKCALDQGWESHHLKPAERKRGQGERQRRRLGAIAIKYKHDSLKIASDKVQQLSLGHMH